jgi:hypothetical protein
MMKANKQAKVISNGDVMGRGPTNEVSRQTAFPHTKIQVRQTAGGYRVWNVLPVWFAAGVRM